MKNNKFYGKRILVIHNRGYFKSGPERFILNFMMLFKAEKIDIFCLDYPENNIANIVPDLPKPLTSSGEYSLSNQKIGLLKKFTLLFKTLFNFEAMLKLSSCLKKERYDYVLICQFHFKLTPSIFLSIKRHAGLAKILIRSSDYYLSCIRNTFTDPNNNICTLCTTNRLEAIKKSCAGSKLHSIHRCIGNLILHSLMRLVKPTLVFTNSFAKDLAEKNRYLVKFNKEVLTTFDLIENGTANLLPQDNEKNYDFIFFGRVAYDKGFSEILKLFEYKTYSLVIVGNVDEECRLDLDILIKKGNVSYFPFLEKSELLLLIRESRFSLIFSCWYDNLPNALIESYSQGVPVICYDFGSFSEFIPQNFKHLFNTQYNSRDLELFIEADYPSFGQAVKNIHLAKFSPDSFIKSFDAL